MQNSVTSETSNTIDNSSTSTLDSSVSSTSLTAASTSSDEKVSTSATNDSTNTDTNSEMVWVGDTGTKYHRQNCRTLKGNGHQITLNQALSEGREPCKVCY